jgi:phosphohistidine phosphatase
MRLLLMRHGEAEDNRDDDFNRSLTANGRAQVTHVGRALVSRGEKPSLIVASPLTRAQQSAAIVRDVLELDIPIETWDEVRPSADPQAASRRLATATSTVLVVSHQPFVGRLAQLMTGKRIAMEPATMLSIHYDSSLAGNSELEWMIDH